MAEAAPLTIGALASRVGVSASALRAWERRYGLLDPARSEGGYRYYTARDEALVRKLLRLRADGVPMPEAVARLLSGEAPVDGDPDELVVQLLAAVGDLDAAAFEQGWDAALNLSVEDLVTRVAMPLLHQVGEAWAGGRLSVAHEHFASHEVRGRLFALRPSRLAEGPRAVLACPPRERHDLGLLAFAVLLANHGWQVRFLGADTPLATMVLVCRQVRPDLVVLSATRASVLEARRTSLGRLARAWPLALGGAGATESAVRLIGGATRLSDDPAEALHQVEGLLAARVSA